MQEVSTFSSHSKELPTKESRLKVRPGKESGQLEAHLPPPVIETGVHLPLAGWSAPGPVQSWPYPKREGRGFHFMQRSRSVGSDFLELCAVEMKLHLAPQEGVLSLMSVSTTGMAVGSVNSWHTLVIPALW